ncbi:glutamate racemase [Leeuwenhoekiella marinoflava]|uniref:Glutamate racemase n=2 Tax=Leeuwenhoekiella marinoflava TaxID=988 RepID=A0A4Q0PMN9_9FLAO|nr:glutamate racemase [Leeuwenhoekiella marinoflava]RXG31671.1 glutamate racemase [Leeuwenhoekiella marinoflava]SHF09181.1 glutamate racemase [Leeuwenhoekiella marinoflava DSM 3653]
MQTNNPIGVFDSGVGGTSILKEIIHALPAENTIYLADIKNAPYGERTSEEILQLAIKNTARLIDYGSKLIVVACNTATTNAIDTLRNTYDIPFIGIEPAIKPAALASRTKSIGILATKGTLSSALFARTSSLYTSKLNVIEVIGRGLVELIEGGELKSDRLFELLASYLKPMIAQNIDHLVLGCSHYPYLIPIIEEILPKNVTIIDSGQAVALQTKRILDKNNLLNQIQVEGEHKLYSNASIEVLTKLTSETIKNKKISYLDF